MNYFLERAALLNSFYDKMSKKPTFAVRGVHSYRKQIKKNQSLCQLLVTDDINSSFFNFFFLQSHIMKYFIILLPFNLTSSETTYCVIRCVCNGHIHLLYTVYGKDQNRVKMKMFCPKGINAALKLIRSLYIISQNSIFLSSQLNFKKQFQWLGNNLK